MKRIRETELVIDRYKTMKQKMKIATLAEEDSKLSHLIIILQYNLSYQ